MLKKLKLITSALCIVITVCIFTVYNQRKNGLTATAEPDENNPNAEFAADLKTLTDEEIEAAYYFENYTGFRYSSLPGQSTWPYENHQDMVDICQIPSTTLEQMPTHDLVQTVLCYPLLNDVYAYNDIDSGYDRIKADFQGLQELCTRSDRVECLYDWLRENRTNFVNRSESTGNAYVDHLKKMYRNRFMILALREEFFPEGMNDIDSVVENINEILANDGVDLGENDGDRSYSLVQFLGISGIVEVSTQTVYTPRGGPMSASTFTVEELWMCSDNVLRTIAFNNFSDDAKTAMKNSTYANYGLYPDSGREASIKYNCHSYAWYSTSSNNTNWVDYFNSSGYVSVTLQNVNLNGIVVYCESHGGNVGPSTERKHSAVVHGKIYHPIHYNTVYDLNMKSKWGMFGVYTHQFSNCPYYYYDSTNYESDRLYYN